MMAHVIKSHLNVSILQYKDLWKAYLVDFSRFPKQIQLQLPPIGDIKVYILGAVIKISKEYSDGKLNCCCQGQNLNNNIKPLLWDSF